MSRPNISRDLKILLVGLDNSGKTSISLSLNGDRNLLSYYSIQPTIQMDIKSINLNNLNLIIWELGGQSHVREDNLHNFDEYSSNVDKVLFVIDVIDKDRYDLVLQYLKEISQKFREIGDYPAFVIFLHKFDPQLVNLPEYSKKTLELQLVSHIRQRLSPEFQFKIYKTSIYTVFSKKVF